MLCKQPWNASKLQNQMIRSSWNVKARNLKKKKEKHFAVSPRFSTNFIFADFVLLSYKALIKLLNLLLSMRIQTILPVNICRISNLSIHFIYKRNVLEMKKRIQIEWVQNNELYLRDIFLSFYLKLIYFCKLPSFCRHAIHKWY